MIRRDGEDPSIQSFHMATSICPPVSPEEVAMYLENGLGWARCLPTYTRSQSFHLGFAGLGINPLFWKVFISMSLYQAQPSI